MHQFVVVENIAIKAYSKWSDRPFSFPLWVVGRHAKYIPNKSSNQCKAMRSNRENVRFYFCIVFGFCVFASIGWWSDCIISIDGVCMCRPAASDGILWCTNRTQWSIPIHAAAITAMRAKNATHTTGLDWRRNGMALYASNMFFYVRLNGIISIKARADEWNIIINTYAQRHCSITSHTHTHITWLRLRRMRATHFAQPHEQAACHWIGWVYTIQNTINCVQYVMCGNSREWHVHCAHIFLPLFECVFVFIAPLLRDSIFFFWYCWWKITKTKKYRFI